MLELFLAPGVSNFSGQPSLAEGVLVQPIHGQVEQVLGVEATLELLFLKTPVENLRSVSISPFCSNGTRKLTQLFFSSSKITSHPCRHSSELQNGKYQPSIQWVLEALENTTYVTWCLVPVETNYAASI